MTDLGDLLDQLTHAGAIAAGLGTETVSVMRPTLTGDGYGGRTATRVRVGDPVPARVAPWNRTGGADTATAGQVATHKVTLPLHTDVTTRDVITRPGHPNLSVVEVRTGTLAIETVALCVEVP